MQINIGHLNENGQYVDGNFTTFALAGNVRAMVRALASLSSVTVIRAIAACFVAFLFPF